MIWPVLFGGKLVSAGVMAGALMDLHYHGIVESTSQ